MEDELRHPSAPPAVRDWMHHAPGWLELMPVAEIDTRRWKRWIVARGQPLRSVSPSDPISSSSMTERALLSPRIKDSKLPERSAFSIWPRNVV